MSLGASEYVADFYKKYESATTRIRKWESRQTFREPGNDSWEAFQTDNWQEAMRLAVEPDEQLEKFYRIAKNRGVAFQRCRLIKLPLTPYLQWELALLRLRTPMGETVRLLGLPPADESHIELISIDEHYLYEISYDDHGELVGARRTQSRQPLESYCRFFDANFAVGVGLSDWDQHLMPPDLVQSELLL